jgi:hypothetical protein
MMINFGNSYIIYTISKKIKIAANPLAPKVQLSLDVKCAPNYTEKLKLMGIATTTLCINERITQSLHRGYKSIGDACD